jgi:WD40 repeat protein
VQANGLIGFAPDAALLASTGGDGTLSRWRFSDLTVSRTTGSGYDKLTTVFNFSPNGQLQSAASKNGVMIQRRSDASILTMLSGGPVLAFSPASDLLAVLDTNRHEVVLYGTASWTAVRRLRTSDAAEGISAVRFTRDGKRLVSTGYFPFVDDEGLWQQKGLIRFWRVSDGVLLRTYDQRTDLAVTSPVAWSQDGTRFAYGLYGGSVVVARTPP